MNKKDKLEQAIANRQSTIDKLIGRNKKDKKELQAVIDKKKEPEKVYSIGDRFEGNAGTKFMLARIPSSKIGQPYVIISQLDNGDLRGSPSYVKENKRITTSEFKELCCGLELTRYYDARKQAKVGEKSEQGKSEPKLINGDYGKRSGTLWIKTKGGIMWVDSVQTTSSVLSDSSFIESRLGNIFDDLTETSEGFEMTCRMKYDTIKVRAGEDTDKILSAVVISINNEDVRFTEKQLAEFHRKLGHILNHIRSSHDK